MSFLRQNQTANDLYTAPQELVYSVAEYVSLLNVQLRPLKATIQGEIGSINTIPAPYTLAYMIRTGRY